jgi:hypothetical protein
MHSFRSQQDGWTTDGKKITSDENLALIREAMEEGPIIVQHWFYRGSSAPDYLIFSDIEVFQVHLAQKARPGDAFDVWSFPAVCHSEQALAGGKLPDTDGTVPLRGAY